MDTRAPSGLSVGEPGFWRRPLAERMADSAGLRAEHGALFPLQLGGFDGQLHPFWAVIGHAELVEPGPPFFTTTAPLGTD